MPKPLLILDLDETLWHGQRTLGGVQYHMRPHLQTFLNDVSCQYDLGVWTAAQANWMHGGLNALKEHTGFDLLRRAVFTWDRAQCLMVRTPDGTYKWRKQARKFTQLHLTRTYPLQRILVLDDKDANWVSAPQHHLAIPPWAGDPDDQELLRIGLHLNSIAHHPNLTRHTRTWEQYAARPALGRQWFPALERLLFG